MLNLRGRIVTAIDMRERLGLPLRGSDEATMMAIGIEKNGESLRAHHRQGRRGAHPRFIDASSRTRRTSIRAGRRFHAVFTAWMTHSWWSWMSDLVLSFDKALEAA